MKKIYLSLIAAVVVTAVSGQTYQVVTSDELIQVGNELPSMTRQQAAKTSSVLVQDDLWYFYNKHNLRNPNNFGYPGIQVGPAASYSATNFISKVGATFENPGTVLISGAAGLALSFSASASPSVPLTVNLYQALGSPLVPVGASLGSFTTTVSGSTLFSFVGGTWTPVPVTGPYALVMSCVSSNTVDAIRVATSNAKTNTATAAPTNERFGERMGIYGTVAGNWASSTGIVSAEDDREAILAPFVDYSFSVSATASTYSTCNTQSVNFVNTSSGYVDNRQYNVNKLVQQFAPFVNTTLLTSIAADSVFTWNFGDATTAYGTNVSHAYMVNASPLTSTLGDLLIGKLKTQLTPSVASQFETAGWTMTVTVCNVGLTENSIQNQLAVYPNPATDRVTVYLNNATATTQIQVLNALGQVVISKSNVSDKNELNTESLSKGVYFVRVANGKELSTTKLIISK